MAQNGRNIYEQQSANKRNTVLVMLTFVCFVGLLGFGVDALILGTDVPVVTIFASGLGFISALRGLQAGARTVLASAGARPIAATDATYQQLSNVTDEMTIASGLPRPALYVIPDPDPNAFATGKDPDHAVIAVTEGLLEKLNRDELQAVVAHEMSHIRNYDIRLMTVVAALIGSVMLLSEFATRSLRFGGGRRRSSSSSRGGSRSSPVLLILLIIAIVLAPLISRILAMAVSRQREYFADASAAELTRNPGALASALEKIDAAAEPTRAIKKGTAHLCIADPLERKVNQKEGFFAELFATHPPVLKRVALLRAMAYQGR